MDWRPVSASPITVILGSNSSRACRPSLTILWSSTSSTRILSIIRPFLLVKRIRCRRLGSERNRDAHNRPLTGLRPDVEFTIDYLHTFLHSQQTEAFPRFA